MPSAQDVGPSRVSEVASVLCPALIAHDLATLARDTAQHSGHAGRAARYERLLTAITGRLLVPRGWAAAARPARLDVRETTAVGLIGQNVPDLTLARESARWRRCGASTHHTDTAVPILARPDKGEVSSRAVRYSTAAALTDRQAETMDEVYRSRWPHSENQIEALVARPRRRLRPYARREHQSSSRRQGRSR